MLLFLQCLRVISAELRPWGRRAAFYLAAAVSDFYIPWSSMVEHKIQSADLGDGLTLTLQKASLLVFPHGHTNRFVQWPFNLLADVTITIF
jgi:hypothetical protein